MAVAPNPRLRFVYLCGVKVQGLDHIKETAAFWATVGRAFFRVGMFAIETDGWHVIHLLFRASHHV